MINLLFLLGLFAFGAWLLKSAVRFHQAIWDSNSNTHREIVRRWPWLIKPLKISLVLLIATYAVNLAGLVVVIVRHMTTIMGF